MSPKTRPAPELLAPRFSLRQVAYLVAAAHHQSVHRAAEALHVSPPAISEAISHLEEVLGVKVFVRRHARGMVLTDAGELVTAHCRDLLAQAGALSGAADSGRAEVHGGVHLGCILSFAPFLVPPLLRAFRERCPRARLHWHEGNHEYLMEGLQSGALEVAILYDFEVPAGIRCVPLRRAPLQAVLPGGHRLARRERISLRQLAAEPMVLLDLPRTREYILSAFGAAGLAPRIEYRAQSVGMLRGLVASGLAYSLLNFCPPYTHPSIGSLVTRPLTARLRAPHIVAAHAHRHRPTAAASALIECAAALVGGLRLTSPPG